MEEKFNKIIEEAKGVSLSSSERQEILGKLEDYMSYKPVRSDSQARLIKSLPSSGEKLSFIQLSHMKLIPSLIILGLIFGGGTSVAASKALPGSTLYLVKTEVNERVAGWFTFGTERQAKRATVLAERRLSEIQTLIASGNLTAEAETVAKTKFEEQALEANQKIAELEAQNKIDAALEVNSAFESSLRAHGELLSSLNVQTIASVSVEMAAAPQATSDALSISSVVEEAITVVVQKRAVLETKARSVGTWDKAQTESKRREANQKIKDTESLLLRMQTTGFETANSSIVRLRINLAKEALSQGDRALLAGSFNEAFILFQKSLRLAKEAYLIITGGVDTVVPETNPDPGPETKVLPPDIKPQIPNPISDEIVTYFSNQLVAIKRDQIGLPIEGYTPDMFLRVYPNLEAKDFSGAKAAQGIYIFKDNRLVFERDENAEAVLAGGGSIILAGYKTLLINIAGRLGSNAASQASIDILIDRLSQGDAPLSEQGIIGVATVGPICPTVQFPSPENCKDRPLQTELGIFDFEGRLVKTFNTQSDGTFKIRLAPGDYSIRELEGSPALPRLEGSPRISVRDGFFTTINLSFDSGIR